MMGYYSIRSCLRTTPWTRYAFYIISFTVGGAQKPMCFCMCAARSGCSDLLGQRGICHRNWTCHPSLPAAAAPPSVTCIVRSQDVLTRNTFLKGSTSASQPTQLHRHFFNSSSGNRPVWSVCWQANMSQSISCHLTNYSLSRTAKKRLKISRKANHQHYHHHHTSHSNQHEKGKSECLQHVLGARVTSRVVSYPEQM